MTIHQDVDLFAARLKEGEKIRHPLKPGRHGWVQITRGEVSLNGQRLTAGDGAALSDEPVVEVTAAKPAEFLLFDLA